MHEKQRIQGAEKQAMDQAFRESLKITPIKHDKDMTSELPESTKKKFITHLIYNRK